MTHRIMPSPPAPWPSWESLIALALAEAFAVGRRLTDDVTGLI